MKWNNEQPDFEISSSSLSKTYLSLEQEEAWEQAFNLRHWHWSNGNTYDLLFHGMVAMLVVMEMTWTSNYGKYSKFLFVSVHTVAPGLRSSHEAEYTIQLEPQR